MGVNESLPAILPGDYFTPDEQCRSQGWDWACKVFFLFKIYNLKINLTVSFFFLENSNDNFFCYF